jgi:hypothetical protein
VPLRVAAMRHLFWGLVLATQQRVQRILTWPTCAAGIKALPNIGTTSDVQFHTYNCSTRRMRLAKKGVSANGHRNTPDAIFLERIVPRVGT